MTRKEVYDKCVEKVGISSISNGHVDLSKGSMSNIIWTVKELLPKEAIDAIIDCAVEEAIERIENMTFATIGGRTWLLTTKSKYVEGGE